MAGWVDQYNLPRTNLAPRYSNRRAYPSNPISSLRSQIEQIARRITVYGGSSWEFGVNHVVTQLALTASPIWALLAGLNQDVDRMGGLLAQILQIQIAMKHRKAPPQEQGQAKHLEAQRADVRKGAIGKVVALASIILLTGLYVLKYRLKTKRWPSCGKLSNLTSALGFLAVTCTAAHSLYLRWKHQSSLGVGQMGGYSVLPYSSYRGYSPYSRPYGSYGYRPYGSYSPGGYGGFTGNNTSIPAARYQSQNPVTPQATQWTVTPGGPPSTQ